ncbi:MULTISPECIES: hypothetical protein [Chryseobacterium]|uniref:Uncharacterized protein n=1 Tax=Chryseobacterium camelliae TaxID=1265445 RepID=A0ABU0THW1_9FLAO|nr:MULTISPECIES: hypothetical protein [Chryseobacterium]MDT3409490.1 hypothetical protein [Pseudacidovorax intermedius]MDQ1096645.1 hypothetical protein [Chryseobacterium camelliae]MDQ1100587.1 hypothetical protein [Chryseobacterium sp. SORGH_AS_1048]MDR6087927.1 hypothetical protein [Chryseobacterium sp. SORGH_AS_0909]MDR6132301.1 hypothetical protein [Chryseobacterium sp. SORGH_AS_1175]
MDYKYFFLASSSIRVEETLSSNNSTEDAMFWSELYDDNHHQSFYFSSLALNELEDTDEIIRRAYQILSIFEGIFKLCEKRFRKYFKLDSLYDFQTKKIIAAPINEPEIYFIDFDLSKLKNSPEFITNNLAYDLFSKIIKSEYLTNLFFLLSKNTDYKLLYMIYDDIKYFLKKEDSSHLLKEFENDIKIFTHTANNYEVLGYFARHGRTSQQPPKKVISLEDSTELIYKIVYKVLYEKFNIILYRL